MVTKNLDMMRNNLRMPLTAKQDRFAVSGNSTGLRNLPAVQSHAWRCASPGSPDSDADPERRFSTATVVAPRSVKRAGRLAASCYGSFLLSGRIGLAPIASSPNKDSRDYLSHGYLAGQRDRIHGLIPPYSSGK